ncbi:TraH family protein [Chelatococcus asaccharovorans]|uniref:TraH family protein n=1 Tax=Chelatococcus asaccharovorans TaxID=28210 RepID=UPI00224C74CA|nr:TraH family protein [Chelatococcus asaccharovorans]CAH1661707.1 Conjugal transfer protein TraH [Chelatococcus asaccharovorans]CAH1689539.1 Conjugal transfer protein TraH [Chelatococcus asaccharovorans]
MVDAALIQQCADPGLTPAIVTRFIAEAGSPDPLAVTVRLGGRVVLVPRPSTADEAMALIRQHVGKAVVRVGVTQYPAGFGVTDVADLKPNLVDACANIRIGTKLFAKVYRIVTKWYGNAVDEAFDDAIYAWKTGNFEGKAVFSEPDPGDVKLAVTASERPGEGSGTAAAEASAQPRAEPGDPNKAGIRIDLSGIGGSPARRDR